MNGTGVFNVELLHVLLYVDLLGLMMADTGAVKAAVDRLMSRTRKVHGRLAKG